MNADALQKVSVFISSVRASGIPVNAAYVFGSQATGKARSYSDIDVCIVSTAFGRDPIAEMVSLRRIAYPLDPRIEPITLHPDDFNDRYSSLIAEIKHTGISIVTP
jgi:predicted nucleotidyltransferase